MVHPLDIPAVGSQPVRPPGLERRLGKAVDLGSHRGHEEVGDHQADRAGQFSIQVQVATGHVDQDQLVPGLCDGLLKPAKRLKILAHPGVVQV